MNKVIEDLNKAKRIIDDYGYVKQSDIAFNSESYVYRSTNEMINSEPYISCISDKRKILSVVASGDQILNSILYGSKNIDGFDISVFPKYYLELKKAGILSLSREDFISFFLGEVSKYANDKNTFSKDLYEEIRKNLDYEYRYFWDDLFFDKVYGRSFPRMILNSRFFDSPNPKKEYALAFNPYLNKTNYEILKGKISDADIKYFEGNIFEIGPNLKNNYDFINLSSIFISNSIGSLDLKYEEFFKKLSLNEKGIILSYLFQYNIDVYNYLGKNIIPDDLHFKFERLKDEDGFDIDGIVTYQKRLKMSLK